MSLSQPAHAHIDLDRIPAGIALLGCGTVGGGVARLLLDEHAAIAARAAQPFALNAVVVRSPGNRPHEAAIAPLLRTDANAAIDDPSIAIVVETIGGTTDAARFVERALARRKHVVTANKDLLATDGPRLLALARANGVSLHYEAAVGGAIPIVRTISESLAGERILEVGGVLNGTTNFILSAMAAGASYAGALAGAQQAGFAESDPSADVEGIDARHKLAILMTLAFGGRFISSDIPSRGISALGKDDLALAKRLGLALKLIAFARVIDSRLAAAVTPAYVAAGHPFAAPEGAQNCIRVIGRSSGSLTFAGFGAGRAPTASAIVGDVIAALRRVAATRRVVAEFAVPAHTARPDAALTLDPGALALRRIIRVRSFVDARPAHAALFAAGIEATLVDGAPAVRTAAVPLGADGDLERALAAAGITGASVIPVWEDAEPGGA